MRLDHVFDLVEGNIGSEVRAKIAAISKELNHLLALAVAKVICLLQYVKAASTACVISLRLCMAASVATRNSLP